MLYSLVVTLVLVAALAGLAIQAVRDDYLLVLSWPKRGIILLEQGHDGRYQLLPLALAPLALARYAWSLVTAIVTLVRGSALSRAAYRLMAPLGVKI